MKLNELPDESTVIPIGNNPADVAGPLSPLKLLMLLPAIVVIISVNTVTLRMR